MHSRRWLLLILILSLAVVPPLTALAADKPGTVRIGVYLPMTGPMAARGQAEYAGIRVAHAMRPMVLDTGVELFLADTAAGNIGTAGAAGRLIKEHKVHALIGEPLGDDPQGGISLTEGARKPTVIPSMPPPVTDDRKYTFYIGLTSAFQGEAAARYASSRLQAKKAALLMNIEREDSIALSNSFMERFMELGGQMGVIAYCRTGDGDFTTQLSSIMAAKVDVLYLSVSYPDAVRICRQSAEMGISAHIVSSDTVHLPRFIDDGGKHVEGVIVTSDFGRENPSGDRAAEYITAYEQKTGMRAGRFDTLGADAYFLLLDAIEKARSTAGSKMRQALARTREFRGISGAMDMGRGGTAVKGAVILQVKGGEFRYVETLPPGKER